MELNSIYIRNAQISDIEDIFWVLHSESIAWNTNEIEANIDNLYILSYKDRLLSVVYGSFTGAKPDIFWTAAHPAFPRDILSSALCNIIFYIQNSGLSSSPVYIKNSASAKADRSQPRKSFQRTAEDSL